MRDDKEKKLGCTNIQLTAGKWNIKSSNKSRNSTLYSAKVCLHTHTRTTSILKLLIENMAAFLSVNRVLSNIRYFGPGMLSKVTHTIITDAVLRIKLYNVQFYSLLSVSISSSVF